MTKIAWTNETINPIVGCTKVSEGCQNCYAEKMAVRLSGMAMSKADEDNFRIEGIGRYPFVLNSNGRWNGKTYFDKNELNKPFQWKKGRMIFVCSMGDLFHESVSFSDILEVLFVANKCPQHIFQILTKRPERMREFFTEWVPNPFLEPLKNVWLGVTAENQQRANKRIPILLQIPAAKRFVSIEPMLGPINLTSLSREVPGIGTFFDDSLTGFKAHGAGGWYDNKLDWVICGSESGTKRRPMDFDWAVSLRDQCVNANVPFFFKQRYVGNKKIELPPIDWQVWDQIPEL